MKSLPLKKLINVLCNTLDHKVAVVTLHWLTILVKQELFKVPGDIAAGDGGPNGRIVELFHVCAAASIGVDSLVPFWEHDLVSEPLEHGLRPLAVNVTLLEEGDLGGGLEGFSRANKFEGVKEFLVAFVGLMTELIARKRKDVDSVPILSGQGIHPAKSGGGIQKSVQITVLWSQHVRGEVPDGCAS